jgi:sigma-B regulation protein RsbU (phosphoserine phosphatase)
MKGLTPGSIRARLFLAVLAAAGLVFGASQVVALRLAEREVLRGTEREADLIARGLALSLDAVLGRIEARVQGSATALGSLAATREDLDVLIGDVVRSDDRIYGSTVAFEPYAFAPDLRDFSPYLHRAGPDLRQVDLAHEAYRYREQPWYRLARDAGRARWSEPYFDAGGGEVWMITYSVPFRQRGAPAGSVSGIMTADLTLDWVREAVGALSVPGGGFGFLVSPSGTFVSHLVAPGADPEATAALRARLARLRDVGAKLATEGRALTRVPDESDGPAYLAFRRMGTLDWSLGLVFPEAALMAPARRLLPVHLAFAVFGLGVLALVVSMVSRRVSRPIETLAGAVERIGQGDLEVPIPASRWRDEVAVLAAAVDRMRASLRRHIEERATSLAAEERLARELDIARQIQQATLPRLHGGAATRGPFLVAATLQPARQVGGDLYDFFALDDRRLLFAVGDVSDKGIPAALFMEQVSGLLRVVGHSGIPPDELLRDLDRRLSEGNDACMFVTATCGLLDGETGMLLQASAGHDPPLIRRAGGTTVQLAAAGGPALGLDRREGFPRWSGRLAPGDAVVAFTDGVTEASDAAGESFGVGRLRQLVEATPPDGLDHLPADVVRAVERFAEGGAPRDDIAVLVVAYRPADTVPLGGMPEEWRLEMPARTDGIVRAKTRIETILLARELPQALVSDCLLVLEEVLTNVMTHAYQGECDRPVQIDVRVTPDEVRLRFADTAHPFDPLTWPDPELDAPAGERPVGGLGVFLVKRLAHRCEYTREGDRNVLTVCCRMT